MARGPKFEEQQQAIQMVSSKIPGFVQNVVSCWQHCFPDTFPLAKFFDFFFLCYQLFLIFWLSLAAGGEAVWFRLSSVQLFLKLSSYLRVIKCDSASVSVRRFTDLAAWTSVCFCFVYWDVATPCRHELVTICVELFCVFLWIQLIYAVAWVRYVCVCVRVCLYWKGCCYSESY